ncbi:MAG: hypothetical protein R3247_06670 [Rhodothermales bacterium]|nr:hypothetical protein [Rhodothermales bacterium]
MPQFDMTGHALLSPTARTIAQADAGAFLALQTLAEEMLRLADADLVVGQVDLARMAVARQLNLLAARSPEQELLSSERRGEDQEFRYRTGAPAIDPVAALIVRQLGIDPEAGTASYDAARRC